MALSKNYFKSKDVRVFPSSFRGTYDNTTTFDPEARLNTEANFIVPKISGNKASYIVNYNTNTIKFVLGGYYFEINNLNNYDLKGKYLNIKLRDITIAENQNANNKDSERKTSLLNTWEANSDHVLDVVDTEDSISYFSGLKISAISSESTAYASIKLFNSEGNINQEAILVDIDHGAGENTLMHGIGLTADTTNQTVFGTYNNNKADTLFEVGNGSGETNKHNALEISTTTVNINNNTNINGKTVITGATKLDGSTEITDATEIKGDLTISNDTGSEDTTTGALKVTGGVGISENLNVGGDTNLNNKLIVKTSPADTETNVEVDGTINITGKTDIYSNVTVDSDKTTLAKPVEITDTSDNALIVKGKTTIEKDLEIGDDTKILTIKNSPGTDEQNVTITGTLKSTGKATFGDELEVASGKTTTLGGQVDITGAVNINTSNQDDPEEITIYGDTTITGEVEITGAVTIEGKATSTSTASTDGDTTLTTKDYVDTQYSTLDTKINNLDFTASSDETLAEEGTGNYIQTVTQRDGKVTTTKYSFETTFNKDTENNAPTSKAIDSYINTKIGSLKFNKTGGDGQYIKWVSESDGTISAEAISFLTEVNSASSNLIAPTANAVWKALEGKSKECLKPLDPSISITDCFIYWNRFSLASPGTNPDKLTGWNTYNIDNYLNNTSNEYKILSIFATPVVGHNTKITDRINGKEDGAEAEQMGRWANAYYVDLDNDGKTFYLLNVNPWDALELNVLFILKKVR